MKNTTRLLMCLLFVAVGTAAWGQNLVPKTGVTLTPPHKSFSLHNPSGGFRTTSCGPDTVEYTIFKASGLRALNINNVTSANAAGQYFDAPQPITISGFGFYGWSDSLPSINVTCSIFLAGADSLPTGAPLVTTTLAVDSSFGGGSLTVLRRFANFTTPVTVTAPYIVVIENNQAFSLNLISSDYLATPADGLGEDLAVLRIGSNWLKSSNVNVGGAAFDADWLIDPIVSYDLGASFTASMPCVTAPNTNVTFTNSSSPIVNNRMYNIAAAIGNPGLSYTWNFGDGSPTVNAVDTNNTYASSGSYTVNLTDSIFGWTSTCVHDTSVVLGQLPSAAFTSSATALTVAFSDASADATTYFWDFGDGNTSTLQNPTHTYSASGTYTVCQTVSGACGSDSTCSSVAVTNSPPPPTAACGPDTAEYTLAKAFGLRALNVSGPASALGQYFDAPQPITISGFDFVGWSDSLPVLNVTCQIYAAGTDSLPTGAPLASTTFGLDSAFGGGSLAVLTRSVSFPTPVTVTAPYVVVVENASNFGTGFVTNDYLQTPPDGLGENLSSLFLNGTWLAGLDINVGGAPFDADWLIYPHVSYDLQAGFAASTACLSAPNTNVSFTNTSSPILGNRMYNQAVFAGVPELSYTWNFGDGSPTVNAVDTNNTYATTGPFTVTLTDTIFGWRTLCTDDSSFVLNPGPTAAFTSAPSGLTVAFTDASVGGTTYAWDFGDGATSTLQSPSHTYAAGGTYTVCLAVTNAGGCSDTICTPVTVAGTPPPTTACGPDTVQYTLGKAFGLRALNISGPASALGQYFDAPQPITISGFDFVGWSDSLPVLNVTCQIYAAGTDSLPTGAPLATTTFGLDSAFGGGALAVLTRSVTFPTPVTVSAPYVIVVENNSNFGTGFVTNDYLQTPPDGLGENLSALFLNGSWLPGLDVNVGGAPFDADWLIYPHASYELEAVINASPICLPAPGTTVSFTNGSSPILGNRMYNQAVFVGVPEASYLWNFGDGSPAVNVVDTNYVYATTGPFTATLTDTIFGWTTICTADTSVLLQPGPASSYSFAANNLNVTFSDLSTGSPTSWMWDFGDGSTSTMQNPSYTYVTAGTYIVCLTASNGGCSDTFCDTITVNSCVLPLAGFTSAENNLSVNFTDLSTSNTAGGMITGWQWDFGDGNSSTLQNPFHVYATAGTYTVCLVATDVCGSDTICGSVTVTPCTLPAAGFTSVDNNLTVAFTDVSTTSSTITSWLWDFGDGNTSTVQNASNVYATPGTYTVCLTVTDGCGSDSSCQSIMVDTLVSVTDPLAFLVNIFPNPANNLLNVEVELEQSENVNLRVYNALGAFVKENSFEYVSQQRLQLEISDLAEGSYMIEIQAGDRKVVRRFTVLR